MPVEKYFYLDAKINKKNDCIMDRLFKYLKYSHNQCIFKKITSTERKIPMLFLFEIQI